MSLKHYAVLALFLCLLGIPLRGHAQDRLGFDGDDLVTPDCAAMSDWFECRSIDDPSVNASVRRGYEYIHHTTSTLGPDAPRNATNTFDDGTPYANASIACSSCHFTGGHVPFGTPFYQVPDKFASKPYFRPLNYNRDAADSILDCFSNCMNNPRNPPKDDPVIQDMLAYIQWVADGVTDPSMKGAGWPTLPGHGLPVIPGVATMTANPAAGATIYANDCAGCHSDDGPGQGEYRSDESRPRVPALWGVNSYTRGAAFYNNQNLGAFVRQFMPYGDPLTLSNQQALDVAAFINQQGHPDGLADQMFCHIEADNIPASLRKPAAANVGCTYPGEPFNSTQIMNGPWAPITAWRNAEIARLLNGMRGVNPSINLLLNDN